MSQYAEAKDRAQVLQFDDIFENDDSIDTNYHKKARLLNAAIQEVGMGRYQWQLFVVTGFGWLADNLWPIVVGLIIPPVVNEFNFEGPFLELGENVGLLVGAAFWGLGSDIWGRKVSFNITLFIIGAFALAAGGSNNHITLSALAAMWSVGVGGNLPVDSAIFLEFIPASHQYLLTVLSVWWAFGQLLGSLVAWPLIGNFSCPTTIPPSPCPRSSNQGWRYFLFSMGGLMLLLWAIRFFVFDLFESPKYLMGRGRDDQATESVRKVALKNRKWKMDDGHAESLLDALHTVDKDEGAQLRVGVKDAARRSLGKLSLEHVRALFKTRKMAYSTSLLIIIWALIGLAFPLYNDFITYYLSTRGADFGDGSTYITYRNQVIIAVIGVPASVIAGFMVELPVIGRRGTLAVSTILTGVFILASTTARTSNALLGWNCGYSFTSNIMYGVLYALSPEIFPTKDRGTGNALVAIANRVFGIMAPIIALYADLTTSVPIFVAGAIFVLAGVISLLLPFEPRGKAAL